MRNAGTPGKFNAAGLPDINAAWQTRWGSQIGTGTGAIRYAQTADVNSQSSQTSSTAKGATYTFAASLDNDVFGASDTVMPASADTLFGIYLGRTA